MTAQPETRKAPMLDPEQAREDIAATRRLIQYLQDRERIRVIPRDTELLARLAAYAEDWARLREGLKRLISETMVIDQHSRFQVWKTELTALLGEGEAAEGGV